MQDIARVCAMFLVFFISACGSNIPSKLDRDDYIGSRDDLSSIPKDGRLQTEHIYMYVSVKIKQEQLRYESASKQQNQNIKYLSNENHINTNSKFEKAAIDHFEFDSHVYHWTKNVINDLLINYTDSSINLRSTMSNVGNPMIAHNLSVIKKYKDDLRFAQQYKLKPKLIATSVSATHKKPST